MNFAEMDFTKPVESFSDKLAFGGVMVLIGMLAVFAVLFVIYLSLTIFKFAFKGANEKKVKTVAASTPVVAVESVASTSNDEIVAVIAAAIAMAESEANGVKLRVVSIKRV